MSLHIIFTSAYCRGPQNDDSCGWNTRYDGDTPARHTRVLAAARRHGRPGHVVHVERGSVTQYGSDQASTQGQKDKSSEETQR